MVLVDDDLVVDQNITCHVTFAEVTPQFVRVRCRLADGPSGPVAEGPTKTVELRDLQGIRYPWAFSQAGGTGTEDIVYWIFTRPPAEPSPVELALTGLSTIRIKFE